MDSRRTERDESVVDFVRRALAQFRFVTVVNFPGDVLYSTAVNRMCSSFAKVQELVEVTLSRWSI